MFLQFIKMWYNNTMLYFDNSATTKISKEALETYNNASDFFYNPSALYGVAGEIKSKIDSARSNIIKQFKCTIGSTFIFTGSATEANNSILRSSITRKDKTYLIGGGEHSSVYEVAKSLLEQGYNIKFIPLTSNGGIDEDKLYQMLDKDVAFVSLIHVSNETGAINNIKKITEKIKAYNKNILVHSDGVQAVGKLNINLASLGVDYYTISAHKINGPKGVGGFFIKDAKKFKAFILGGGQEMALRSGTENIPAILSFECALSKIELKDFFKHKEALLKEITAEHVLVSDNNCVDNIISICFAGVRGETIVHKLEELGFLIGTGSACNSKAKGNRVLSQFVDRKYIEGAVRISFGKDINVEDCASLGKVLNNAVDEYKRIIK